MERSDRMFWGEAVDIKRSCGLLPGRSLLNDCVYFAYARDKTGDLFCVGEITSLMQIPRNNTTAGVISLFISSSCFLQDVSAD